MQTIITQRLVELKQQFERVSQELAHLAQRQQALLQESLQLAGAIREFETIVVAHPAPVDGQVPVS